MIEATKTATFTDNDSDGVVSLNDRIDYTILVQNKSNVTLDNISVSDDLTDISGTTSMVLDTGPSFSSSNQGSSFGILKPNEIATFVGHYILGRAMLMREGFQIKFLLRLLHLQTK